MRLFLLVDVYLMASILQRYAEYKPPMKTAHDYFKKLVFKVSKTSAPLPKSVWRSI